MEKQSFDEILKRLTLLEKQVSELKKGNSELVDFKDAVESIMVTENDLKLSYSSSMKEQIIRILSESNKKNPFLKWKRQVYKADGLVSDEDILYMIEYVEKELIKLHKSGSKELKPEEFFEKAEIIYGLNQKKIFKKIKVELLQSL